MHRRVSEHLTSYSGRVQRIFWHLKNPSLAFIVRFWRNRLWTGLSAVCSYVNRHQELFLLKPGLPSVQCYWLKLKNNLLRPLATFFHPTHLIPVVSTETGWKLPIGEWPQSLMVILLRGVIHQIKWRNFPICTQIFCAQMQFTAIPIDRPSASIGGYPLDTTSGRIAQNSDAQPSTKWKNFSI